ncbi:MAG: DGQHR domain-containing protein [Verrucomicrobia bacterium]|nr:DGQHR domain-containing protein [Verrucomicrobiota bacterium]
MIFEDASTGNPDPIKVEVFEVHQPIGVFYVGVMKATDLQFIAYADTRRQSKREIESYSGIQRELSTRRQTEIQQYIGTFDAAFPNSFIIQVKSSNVLTEQPGALALRRDERTASIIDGQHRLAGFNKLNSDNFDLIVAIFIDLPLEDQAMLFATINLKQTKVNPSLVYDLFDETKARSPQKTCHHIAKGLNTDKTSPFYHQIKPLGKRTEDYVGKLTQATFVKRLLPLICIDPDLVRDRVKRGETLEVDDPGNKDCVFWRFFVENKDWAILRVVMNYFKAVADVFGDDWTRPESPLGRTIGFSALMRLLDNLARKGLAEKPEPRLDAEFFNAQLKKAVKLCPFTFDTYPASGVGETRLYKAFESAIFDTNVSDGAMPIPNRSSTTS